MLLSVEILDQNKITGNYEKCKRIIKTLINIETWSSILIKSSKVIGKYVSNYFFKVQPVEVYTKQIITHQALFGSNIYIQLPSI